jgi:hypothetical protein
VRPAIEIPVAVDFPWITTSLVVVSSLPSRLMEPRHTAR